MRTLVLSIGNSTVFGGVFVGSRLSRRFRVPHDQDASAEAFARNLRRELSPGVDLAALCSVVPGLTKLAVQQVLKTTGVQPRVLTAASEPGIRIAYRRPAELGTDRLACALGAKARFPGRHVIVVDCGTATTVTAIHRSGRILGGAILPGMALWSELLASRTAQLPRIEMPVRPEVLGRSPAEAIRSGVFHGHAGAVRELVRLIRAEAFGRAQAVVLGTGGHAPALAKEKLFTVLAPDLILNGLFEFATQDTDHA